MDFDRLIEELKTGVGELARELLGELMDAGKKDGVAFLEASKKKLEEWTHALADGKMTRDEFEWLVQSQKSLAEMNLLKQKGLAQAKIDKFTNGVIHLIIDAAFKAIP